MAISNAADDGVRLTIEEGIHTLSRVEISGAGNMGVRVEGPARFLMEGSRIADNRAGGLHRSGGHTQLFDSEFTGNGPDGDGVNLALGRDVFGRVQNSRFQGGVGISFDLTAQVVIEGNAMANHSIAFAMVNSRPRIIGNFIASTDLVMEVSGFQVPARVEFNSIEGSGAFIHNLTDIEVVADNNWWGTADAASISRGMMGEVVFRPFLNFDPRFPLAFELKPSRPNPFDGSTVIDYTVGIMAASVDANAEITLEVRNVMGGLVRLLVREPAAPGIYSATWDGRDEQGRAAASGVYVYVLKVGGILLSQKLTAIR